MLAFDLSTGGISKLIPYWRWEDQLSACSSLVTVMSGHGSRVAQFSQDSVKGFLTISKMASAGMSGVAGRARMTIASHCQHS